MLLKESCFWILCIAEPANASDSHIFGFAEFVGALALMTLLYLVSDAASKFRLSITPGLLYVSTFILIVTIGVGTLAMDLWAAEGWRTLTFSWMNFQKWQALFGFLFLATFVTWVYYAFIRPPLFSSRNYKQFGRALYRAIVKGNDEELAVVANEVLRSADRLIEFANKSGKGNSARRTKRPGASEYANDILYLLANRKLCRHIVSSSPATALALFESASNRKTYTLPLGQFCLCISTEAIANKDSLLYHEDNPFNSGLIGRIKPWSRTIYGDFRLVEALANQRGSPFDISYVDYDKWDGDQFSAFCRSILVTLKAQVQSDYRDTHSYALIRALEIVKGNADDVRGADVGSESFFTSDAHRKLSAAVSFINDAIEILDKADPIPNFQLRRKKERRSDIFDRLAKLISEIVFAVATTTGPPARTWGVHYGTTWSGLFRNYESGPARRVVLFKARRLLYDEVIEMSKIPNYKGARILGYLLSVLGFERRRTTHERSDGALAIAVRAWAQAHYIWMRQEAPDVAASALIGRISLDENGNRLVKTYEKGLSAEAPKEFLLLKEPAKSNPAAV
jgi:hypothetical protein